MRVNPNDPAYPSETKDYYFHGMPIRLKIASKLMGEAPYPYRDSTIADLAKGALDHADALIAAYNNSQPDEAKDEG